jgi:hypothetical protein
MASPSISAERATAYSAIALQVSLSRSQPKIALMLREGSISLLLPLMHSSMFLK